MHTFGYWHVLPSSEGFPTNHINQKSNDDKYCCRQIVQKGYKGWLDTGGAACTVDSGHTFLLADLVQIHWKGCSKSAAQQKHNYEEQAVYLTNEWRLSHCELLKSVSYMYHIYKLKSVSHLLRMSTGKFTTIYVQFKLTQNLICWRSWWHQLVTYQ